MAKGAIVGSSVPPQYLDYRDRSFASAQLTGFSLARFVRFGAPEQGRAAAGTKL